MNMSTAISAYQRIGVESGVEAANPHKLILMLFEGALEALVKAKMYIQQQEIAKKGEMLSKAIAIIDEGLKASLNMNTGGELAVNLYSLYEYMSYQLVKANLQNNLEILDEVSRLLSELHGAWKEIGAYEKPAVQAVVNAG